MKKFANLMFGLSAAVAFTACSSADDVTMPGASGDVTVTVVTNDALISRAGVTAVNGYDFKCVMQLVSDAGTIVGQQAVADASAGTASFTIKAADLDAGATKALFWAEYVPTAGATKVYNTADLTAVSYNVTEFDMANADLMAAADAFAGTITTLENGAKATLSRPMIQFNFRPTNPEAAAGANKLVVKYEATSGYNVLTSNCVAASSQELTYTNAAFDPMAAGNWFSSLIFAPANLEKFDKEIVMTLSGTTNATLTIPANTLPMDANNIVNTKAEITVGGGDQNLNVDVTVNGSYDNEPKPAVFEVGAYVNAAGKPVSTKEEAVAIVYAVGALNEDVIANYPSEFAGKTIKGYAVALDNATATVQSFGTVGAVFTPNEKEYTNGITPTANMMEKAGETEFGKAYTQWTTAHALTGENVSGWYLPVKEQMAYWMGMIFFDTDLSVAATGSEGFIKMFSTENLYGEAGATSNFMIATCTINSTGKPSGARLMATGNDASPRAFTMKQIDTAKENQKAFARPMFTVFE